MAISSKIFGSALPEALLCSAMNANAMLTRTGNLLRNRVLRNIALWATIFLLSHGMSMEEDALHHYGFKGSPWYWRVLLGSLALQLILTYVNNLVLVPRLLVKRRRLAYTVALFLLLACISVCYTLGFRIAATHINLSKMEMVAMPAVPIAPSWSMHAIREEAQSYFLGNLVWASLFTMAWYMNDYARQRRAADLARRQQAETELAALHSQLAPHFLFNTLNNIYALTLRESSAAPEAMLKLSAILRSLLYERGDALVPFEKEAALIHAYTDLELLRLKNLERMNIQVSADGEYSVPPLLWLPVLENIFKHGTRIISDELFVEFSFIITEGTLTICGRNYCKEAPVDGAVHKGIGLENLQRRLKLLYPGRHSFGAACRDHVFTTEVTVKLT